MPDTPDTRDRLTKAETRIEGLAEYVAKLGPRLHDLAGSQQIAVGEARVQSQQIAALTSNVSRLLDALLALSPLAARVDGHENECVEAHRRNEVRLRDIEEKIDKNAEVASQSRELLEQRVNASNWRAAYAVMGIMLAALAGTIGAFWAFIVPRLTAVH